MTGHCIVEHKIDYEKEAIGLIFRIMNNITYRELKADMLKRSLKSEHPHIIKLLDQLSAIEEGMKPYIDLQDKRLQFYFNRFAREELCIAKILVQGSAYIKSQDNIIEKKKALSNYIKRIREDDSLEIRLTKDELLTNPYEDGVEISLLERVEHLECDDARKWKILYLLKHEEEYMDELFQLLTPITERLKSYESSLQNLMDECAGYWEDYFRYETIGTIISKFYGLTEDSYPVKTTYVRPLIMDCNQVVFIGNDETMGDYHVLEVGITFDKNFEAMKKKPTKEQICSGLKLLSDPSKFEILRKINGRKAYGQELANMTNLTTATISHHMTTLMGFGFITIEKTDNKVFYTMNRKAITEFLMTTMDVLVEEEKDEI